MAVNNLAECSQSKNNRILISAGGTGGHVFPGLALAEELSRRGYEVHWMGTAAGIESRLVPAKKIPLHIITVQGLRGKGLFALLKAPLNIVRAVLQARVLVKQVQPLLIVGLGGFVSGPAGIASKIMSIPLVIHEQNAVAGTTNKLLSRIANKVLAAFPNVFAQAQCIGNPVRAGFFSAKETLAKKESRGINILVVGGSRGARAINCIVPKALKLVAEKQGSIALLHQTGDKLLDETKKNYSEKMIDIQPSADSYPVAGGVVLTKFIDDMATSFKWADLVICRAGALTISELAASGVGSILIPFPFAIDDHQTANAQYLVDENAALLWQQKALTADALAKAIEGFIDNPHKLIEMGMQAKKCAKPNAVNQFADNCEQLINAA